MPLLAGAMLGDASGNNVQDASTNNVGEPTVVVRVAYGGFLLAETPWYKELEDFLTRLEDAINIGKDFVEAAVLANITNGVIMLLDNQKRLTWNASSGTATYEGPDEVNWTGYTLKGVLDAIADIEPGGGLTEEQAAQLAALQNTDPADIWAYPLQFPTPAQWYNDLPMWALMLYSSQSAFFQSLVSGLPLPNSPYFRLAGPPDRIAGLLDDARTAQPQLTLPADPDLSLVEEGDTVLSFLQRTQPSFDWETLGGHHYWDGGTVGVELDSGGNVCWVICTLRDLDLVTQQSGTIITGEGFAAIAVGVPPVWPGEDNVTLGEPVALTTGLTLSGTMDGVLIDITAVDQYKTWYMYHNRKAYRHIGSLAFIADNGAVEQYQVIAFASGVYTPLHMEHAAGVVIRTAAGTTGTATPWARSTGP